MEKVENPGISVTKNGPYIVNNLKKFKNSKCKELRVDQTMALCRCGGSKTKPYCDGTHAKIGFKGDKEPDIVPDEMDHYEGKEITVHDNRGVCSHRGHCTNYAPKIFRMNTEPWIDADADDAKHAAKVIKMCPSGALSYTKGKEDYKDQEEREPGIMVTKDGPYDVVGFIELIDPDENKPESKEHYTLCRCGASKNKPFCSGQHWHIKFRDDKN